VNTQDSKQLIPKLAAEMIISQLNVIQSSKPTFLTRVLLLFSYFLPSLPSNNSYPTGFPTKIQCTFFVYSIPVKYTGHCKFSDFTVLNNTGVLSHHIFSLAG
jgi:hypothetical protein